MNALHYKAASWVGQGVFDSLSSFSEFETRVNDIFEEKDRGDVFEIFIEGYLATQAITQHVKHWVVGRIPVDMRERFNLPNDGTGIDGIYEERGGSRVAYQVKYRKNHNLTFAEIAPFLGITEKFTDRVIFTNASSLSEKAVVRTRWYSGEVFNALTRDQFDQIEAWLKEKPVPVVIGSSALTNSQSVHVQFFARPHVGMNHANNFALALKAVKTGRPGALTAFKARATLLAR